MKVTQLRSLFSLSFSFQAHLLPSPLLSSPLLSFLAYEEAIDWLLDIADEDRPDALGLEQSLGLYLFKKVAIRVDLLSYLIRENYVVGLELNNVEISSPGLAALFDVAMHSEEIQMLKLAEIDFDNASCTALATLMKRSTSIMCYIMGCTIQDADVALLCEALAGNSTIEELYLLENNLGLEGARSISRLLQTNDNRALTKLNLRGNQFGNEGISVLIDGLRRNTSLRKLKLCDCRISDDGAIALASFLEHGSHLNDLSLQYNQIGEAGMLALANALKFNRNLSTLKVFWNPGVNREGVEDAFIEALASNVTLLELRGINSSKIEALLLRNKDQIPAAVRCAALLLIGIRRSIDIEGMGGFAIFPKDIVRLIAQTVYATRRDPIWIHAIR